MREREPTSTTEDLKIEVDGETHRGQRVVLRVSDEEIRQEIRYELLRQVDPDVYRTHEGDFMRAIAREIMWRLVKQWKAQGDTGSRTLRLGQTVVRRRRLDVSAASPAASAHPGRREVSPNPGGSSPTRLGRDARGHPAGVRR